ncbi:phage tail protein I [Vibrio injensis]|uniref:phage tail protein I n=1 Tax=Vibrio injensis TaxID=1307414 RepID=UPI00093295F7|nr:phage tail protein I [Vibrio injensis]
MSSLLPPNATELEKELDEVLARQEQVLPPIREMWDPWSCPTELLPWLAWSEGVDEWDSQWPEQVKRQVIASTPEIRKHRGTVWAVREALRAAGYADAELQEGMPVLTHDGSQLYDQVETYGGGARWALFKVIADIGEGKGVGGAELNRLLRLIDRAKNVRSVLREVAYRASVDDVIAAQDDQTVDVLQTVEEVRPWGRRYDGVISHNQATQLPRAPQYFDGAYRHTGELRHDGLRPYHDWDVTGERYDNQWDEMVFGLRSELDESHQVAAHYDGAASYEAVLSHGDTQPPAVDAGLLNIVLRRRHNGRLNYAGGQQYAGSAPISQSF